MTYHTLPEFAWERIDGLVLSLFCLFLWLFFLHATDERPAHKKVQNYVNKNQNVNPMMLCSYGTLDPITLSKYIGKVCVQSLSCISVLSD